MIANQNVTELPVAGTQGEFATWRASDPYVAERGIILEAYVCYVEHFPHAFSGSTGDVALALPGLYMVDYLCCSCSLRVLDGSDIEIRLAARRAFRRRCYVFAIFTNHGRGTFSPGIGRRMVWSRAGSSSSSRHS